MLVPVYVVLGVTTAAAVVYLAVMVLAAAAACLGVRDASPVARPAARMTAASLVLYAIGDVTWSAVTWHGGDPDPSVADIFYLSSYAMVAATLFLLMMPLRAGRRVVDADVVIDVLTVVTVCVLVLWEFGIRNQAAGFSLSRLGGQTELLYPLVDALLIGLALRALGHPRARAAVGLPFGVGLACWLLGDYAYVFIDMNDWLLVTSNALWMVGALLIAVSGTRLARLTPVDVDRRESSSTGSRLALAILPLLVPPGLVVVEAALGHDTQSWSLVVGIVVLIALAFARTERLLASERRTLRELALARDAALEASRAKTSFLASISHEIRTPMNGVLGLSQLLGATLLDEDQQQYTHGIQSAGESLMVLLDDVLDFAKFETGRVETESLEYDVVELIEDVAGMVAGQAHHRGLELLAHASPGLPRWLLGDPTRIRQVLLNYAANAVKFTGSGEVVISASLEPGSDPARMVRYEVRDTGIGIAEKDLGRLFEAFTQAEVSTTRTYGGTGLGLAIVQHLVTAMDGEVGVTSTPGLGSTFWCTLPLRPAVTSQLITTRPSRALPGTPVLVVDDSASAREVLREQLTGWGLQVDAVPSGPAALAALELAARRSSPYALVVLDHDMPHMDGLELARRIHVHPTLPRPPMMLLTSGPLPPIEVQLGAGIEVSLPKPVQLSRLQGAVQRALGAGPAPPAPFVSAPRRPMDRGVVLVVEDSEVNRLVAVGTLRQLGYLTEVAVNGREAVEAVTTRNYDAVLMDCRMPVMDGYDATIEIRRLEEHGPRTPIIAVTANASADDRRRCLEIGMDDYLAKPIGRQQVADTLARWVPSDVRSTSAARGTA